MEQAYMGIDVSKDKLDVFLSLNGRSWHRVFQNNSDGHLGLLSWIEKHSPLGVHACLEATGQYGDAVAETLFENGHAVSVVNPARIKAYADSTLSRNKTDKVDAILIAKFCEREKPSLWTPPPAKFRELKALVHHLLDLQDIRQQESNRLQSGVSSTSVLFNLQQHIAFLDQQIASVKVSIQELIDDDPKLKSQQDLLITIPGIGKLTAAKLLSEVRSFEDFTNARQLAAYAGLTPKNRRSGTSVHKRPRLSKTGNANLRSALYMPAVVASRWNPIIRDFCERLAGYGLPKMAIIGAAMRKLLHLAYGVLKSGKAFDPNYAQNLQIAS